MIPIENRRYLTPKAVAKIFGVKPVTVNRWAKTGILKGSKRGTGYCFLPEDVEAFIKPVAEDSPQQ